jgi:hypothetical protein
MSFSPFSLPFYQNNRLYLKIVCLLSSCFSVFSGPGAGPGAGFSAAGLPPAA